MICCASPRASLDRAASLVAAYSPHARRVAFVQAGLTYTRIVVENIGLMDRYWKEKDDAIAKQVRGNWRMIEALIAAHPYSLNWGPLRPGTPRTLGLYTPIIRIRKRKNLRQTIWT